MATPPIEANGLGLTSLAARSEIERMERFFTILPETDAVYPAWKRLVIKYEVCGKPAHDPKLVAAMQVHGIRSILTFDRSGFSRYPGIEVVDPVEVVRTR